MKKKNNNHKTIPNANMDCFSILLSSWSVVAQFVAAMMPQQNQKIG